jgi:aldehyde:ferredoxin oxidoreductase
LNKPQPTKILNEEKIEFALKTQYNYSAMDTLGLCQFVFGPSWQLLGPQDMADLLAASTGWTVNPDDVQKWGQMRLNLMRALNAREGLNRDDDTLPKKLFKTRLSGGRSDGLVLEESELANGLDMYYEQAGWDIDSGVPTRESLEKLGLAWAADDLNL